jgi:hypothetical protein
MQEANAVLDAAIERLNEARDAYFKASAAWDSAWRRERGYLHGAPGGSTESAPNARHPKPWTNLQREREAADKSSGEASS